MSSKYEHRETPSFMEKVDKLSKDQFVRDCFNAFLGDVYPKWLSGDSEPNPKFSLEDMKRAYTNGWHTGIFHNKETKHGGRNDRRK